MITAIRVRFLRAAVAAGIALTGLLLPAAGVLATLLLGLQGSFREIGVAAALLVAGFLVRNAILKSHANSH